MPLENRLELKLAQKLILTPQLQQALKLLQLPQLELTQALSQELMENPFLEEVIEAEAGEKSEETPPESTDLIGDAEAPLDKMLDKMFGFGVDEYFDERGSDGRDLGYFTPGAETPPPIEQTLTRQPDLTDHLLWQLRFADAQEEVKGIAEIIIANLDDDGYLRASIEEIAELGSARLETVNKALRLIHGFDPPGVGARDVSECLLIQIRQLGLEGSIVERIVKDCLDDLEKKRYHNIAKRLDVSLDDVLSAVKVIEGLEPRPGRNFFHSVTNYIVPDVYFIKTEDGYNIVLNDEGIPRLGLSNYYRRLLSNKALLSPEERQFLNERLKSAIWLLKSLDQRNSTIYRVAESILKFQREFFDKGIEFLRPLNLRDVALDLGMHESTISRVTSNKYVQCPHGIFSFRFFFSTAIKGDRGSVSSTSVKDIIRKIITEEDASRPLSDSELVKMLKARSIVVARRTIAKYRTELKIPPQNRRKKATVKEVTL